MKFEDIILKIENLEKDIEIINGEIRELEEMYKIQKKNNDREIKKFNNEINDNEFAKIMAERLLGLNKSLDDKIESYKMRNTNRYLLLSELRKQLETTRN